MAKTLEQRFKEKIKIETNGCWVWTAYKSNGYGRFRVSDRSLLAHRVSYELYIGEIPNKLPLDHLCRNRACVNPEHLEPVSQQVNLLRGETIPAYHSTKTHCPQNHEYTEENTYVSKSGSRYCRTCRSVYSNRSYYKKKQRLEK